jgi:hypothetical protein
MYDWPSIIGAIATLVAAFGVKEIVQGWSAKRTGEAQEEKARMKELMQDNDSKDEQIDKLLKDQRKMKEYASVLRIKLMEHGVSYQDLPDWPRGE